MRPKKKNRQVQMLERERSQKIGMAYELFQDKKNVHYNDRGNSRF